MISEGNALNEKLTVCKPTGAPPRSIKQAEVNQVVNFLGLSADVLSNCR